jgi:hypothetical protein
MDVFYLVDGLFILPDEGKGLSANDEYYQKGDQEDVKGRKQLKSQVDRDYFPGGHSVHQR